MLYRLAFQCCKNATKHLKIPRVNQSLTTHAAEWSPQIMEGKMFDRRQRQLIMLEQIKRAVHKNREVLVILRDHSAIFGRAPVIIEDKQIQFCSSDNKLPVVLPLEKFGLWEQRVFSVARLPRPSHMPLERLWESMLYDNNLKAREQLLGVMTPVANAIKTSHSSLVFAVDHAGSAP